LSTKFFPSFLRGVKVTGVFGWPSVPDAVKEACYLIANREKSLWNAPFGQTGAGELGAGLNMTDATLGSIREMLKGYRTGFVVGAV
jgi:hypothetical protein